MSRIGKRPIDLESSVKISMSESEVAIQGPKGRLVVPTSALKRVKVKHEDAKLLVERLEETGDGRREQGLIRALLNSAVIGVTKGFSKELDIIGVGYKAEVKGKNLMLNLGFSHDVPFPIPQGIEVRSDKDRIFISGADKWLVGETAARIRRIRPPEPYKGKGVRYANEHVRRKEGKAAAGAAGGAGGGK